MYLAAPDFDLICLANMNDTQVLCNDTLHGLKFLERVCLKNKKLVHYKCPAIN